MGRGEGKGINHKRERCWSSVGSPPSRFSSEHANMVGLVLGLDFMETPLKVRIILNITR